MTGVPTSESVVLTGSDAVALDDPQRAWIVVAGQVLVFASDASDMGVGGARELVLEAGPGDLLVGVDAVGAGRRWVLTGLARAEVRGVSLGDLLASATTDDEMDAGPTSALLDRWLQLTGAQATAAETLAAVDPVWALREHGSRAALAEAESSRQRRAVEAARIEASEADAASTTRTAVDALAHVFDWRRYLESQNAQGQDELVDACRIVASRVGVEIAAPTAEDLLRSDALTAISRASKVRLRSVALEQDWWRREGQPLLGQLTEGRYVALIPRGRRGFAMVDPATGSAVPVDATVAGEIRPTAIALVRPVPEPGMSARALVAFALRGERWDVVTILVLATIVGLLALVPPLATQVVFAEIVPRDDIGRLWAVIVGIVGVAIASAMFELVRGAAMVRIRGRGEHTVQMGLWDRMLRLSPAFFRRYQVGDLVERSMVVRTVSQQVPDSVVIVLLAGVFGLFNVVAMFIISPPLAGIGLLLCAAGGFVIYLARRAYARPQLDMLAGNRALSAEVLQYFNGIVKIRTSGSERRVFSRWATSFAQQNAQVISTYRIDNARIVFQASFRTAALLVVFVVVSLLGPDAVPAASFMAFYLAFGQLLQAIFQISTSSVAVLEGVPVLEQARPILDTATEADDPGEHPGPLAGRIEVRHVRFRYPGASSDLFDDVSLTIESGEFVAVVGPSGSGKSTLLRLLLGFDQPDAGRVLFDGKDLSGLDIDAVRQQLGVVLQQTALLPGSLRQNISGSAVLTEDEVWEAARQAGLAQDIEQLPGGLDADIGDGVSVLSGGQQQRMQIARALASKPRMLFLDEATSALDNLTQAIVSKTVSEMEVTRVVIAHRLSTIAAADRVILIDGGRVAQDGPFDELANTPGPFAELISRQQL